MKTLAITMCHLICFMCGYMLYKQHDTYRHVITAQEVRIAELEGKKLELQGEKEGLQLRFNDLLKYCKDTPNGEMGVSRTHMQRVIAATLSYLGVSRKDSVDWERLLLLTIAAESDGGRLLKQVRGPARGVLQCEPATEREVLGWLKRAQPDLYKKVHNLRVPAHLTVHEMEYNTAYAVAIAYSLYVWRKVNPHKQSLDSLAKQYKRKYNTPAGKATVRTALAKANAWGVE